MRWGGMRIRSRRRWRQRDADTGAADGDRGPSDEQRQRRYDLEIDDRLDAHPPHLSEVSVPRDADDERRKQQRRHDRSNQTDEDRAEDAELSRCVGKEVAEGAADNDGDEDPGGE